MDPQKKQHALKFQSEVIDALNHPENLDNSTNEVIDDFMKLVNSRRSDIRQLKSSSAENDYKRYFSGGMDTVEKIMVLGQKVETMKPDKMLLDVIYSIIRLLEMSRHDLFLEMIQSHFISIGYHIKDTDFKLKKYFPTVTRNLTPDLLFMKDDKWLIIEAKVTVDSDLKDFYDKYKFHVENQSDVLVINLNTDGITKHGDFIGDLDVIMSDYRTEVVFEMIRICSSLRSIYSRYPEFSYFSSFYTSIEGEENFILNFKKKFESLEVYDEIKSIFKDKFDDLINAVNNFSLITNEENTINKLNNAENNAIRYCKQSLGDFQKLYDSNKQSGLYKQTVLTMGDISEFQDEQASKTYDFTEKLGVSLYMPLTTGFKINKKRIEHYTNVFSQDFKPSDYSSYTIAVKKMLNILATGDSMDVLLGKDEHISDTHNNNNYKRNDATIISESPLADLYVYQNNAFSLKSDHSESIRNGICKYDKSHNRGQRKSCLNYQKESSNLDDFKSCLINMFRNRYNNESYKKDLSDYTSDFNLVNPLSSEHSNNFLDYLFVQHLSMKALISINVISNKKFRFLQTPDPNTIIISLPNSDAMAGAPLRYFVASIVNNEDLNANIKLNKYLGIYNSHLSGNKISVLISKVISLDINRIKLLSTSFAKYCQLISYYRSISTVNNDVQVLSLLCSNLITISSLSITDTFKNIMMVCYSTFSNPEELIRDKLECRPRSMAHIYLLDKIFLAISRSQYQRDEILKGIKSTKMSDDDKEVVDTGFDISSNLFMPISGLRTTNPKEILHESYILFYLGNKGLHGSPQELLNLYHVPYQFEKEYTDILSKHETFLQEYTNNDDIGCSYEAMKISTILTYSSLHATSTEVRNDIKKDLAIDESILRRKQFTSTKSMVRETEYGSKIILSPNDIKNLSDLENYIKAQVIDDPDQFIIDINEVISKINKDLMNKNLVDAEVYGEIKKIRGQYNRLPSLCVKTINDSKLIVFKDFKKSFFHPCGSDMIKQTSDKVFNCVIETIEKNNFKTLRSIYESKYIDENKPLIRIFYKDQRSFVDREIYTGNLTTRLCLYPVETLFKTINKRLPEEAITISGDRKQKKMLDQRIDLLKKRKQYNRNNTYKTDILSMSCDASKWSARDMSLKYLITIAYNPYLTSEEKYFYIYLFSKYYKKYIILTDDAFYNAIKFKNDKSESKIFEELTSNFKCNYQVIRSNWLQGNLNATSSFVHYCSARLSQVMLDVINKEYDMLNHMNFMVHSDDSVYDFLIMKKGQELIDSKYVGTFLYSLIQWSTRKHCITINRKKTYISNFYKEFLSTVIVGNELFYFYLADLLPISSDVTYDSPLDDLSAYSGYINNAFIHACPMSLIKISILLINHLTMSTYNLNISSNKSPYNVFINNGDNVFTDLPIQILPRYKIPIELAGVLPYYSGDSYKIFTIILNKLKSHIDLNDNFLFEDLFNIELIKKYLEKEANIKNLNYIKACLLTSNDDIITKVNEDPYNLTDLDFARKNLIAVLPVIKERRFKRTFTRDMFNRDEMKYRLLNSVNPFWSICNPDEHADMLDKIICNYSDKKFIDSLTFSRPHIDYARRIISSNSKIYRYNLNDDPNLMQVTDLYKRINNDIQDVILTPQRLLNYIQLHLFTDKKVAMAIHLFYTKKETESFMRDKANYNVCIPKSIYPSDYGQHSVSTIIRDLLVNPKSKDVKDIDPKSSKFIELCTELLISATKGLKLYIAPEDTNDEKFKQYCNFKYLTDKYVDCLIPVQEEFKTQFNDYSLDVYNIKVMFQALIIEYYSDIKKRFNDPSHNINYMTPRSVILTVDAFMKRDLVTSKIHISTRKSGSYEQYLLDRFGMYENEYLIKRYKVDYRIRIANERLLYTQRIEDKEYEDVSFIKFIYSKAPYEFQEMRETKLISGRRFDNILQSFRLKPHDLSSTLFLRTVGIVDNNYLINKLHENKNVMNCWRTKTSPNNRYSRALYIKKGIVLDVTSFLLRYDVNSLNERTNKVYDFSLTFYRPMSKNIERQTRQDLLNKFRTDFKDELKSCITISNKRTGPTTIYKDNLFLTLDRSNNSVPLTNYSERTYTSTRSTLGVDDNGNTTYNLKFLYSIYNEEEMELFTFVFREKNSFNYPIIYDYLKEYRDDKRLYNSILNSTNILGILKESFGCEYIYMTNTSIIDHIDKYDDMSGEGEAFSNDVINECHKLYSLYNTMSEMELETDDPRYALRTLLNTFENECVCTDQDYLDKKIDYNKSITRIISLNVKPILSTMINTKYRLEHKPPYQELINMITYNGMGSTKSKILSMIYYICRFYIHNNSESFSGFE
ncbi:RNA-dependent RNA polymerase [Common oak ringspot-associated virus]|uniref:RNA-directed RNA polymerase L n=2 Tax=Common oak ringspot-associated virus TaxID=2742449 RepID=A0A7G2A2L9_9VIRU|nr:RNA-dependent RNA polymerase [Common oak ringspot-associated virus]CAD0281685.1 RNA-dependent RNA polymerase [Common oak ringspot-associated virus]